MKKQINNGFDKRYYLTEEGCVFDTENNDKQLKISSEHKYRLKTTEGKYKKIALKTLYRLVFDKEFCYDTIKNLENEEWKEIEDTNGKYYVSNKGRVKSLTGYEAVLLKPTITSKGYERLQIYKGGIHFNMFVHRIVAAAFLEQPQSINFQLHHKDLDRLNNSADNLIWVSPKDHFKIHREIKEKKHNAKLSEQSKPKENTDKRREGALQ